MGCSECRELWKRFEVATARYEQALNASFYLVSPHIAQHEYVRMQRAQNDLQEHQHDCAWANLVDALLTTGETVEDIKVECVFAAGTC